MPILKKLILAPLFLISFISLIYLITPLLQFYDFIFSLSLPTLINLVSISLLISLSSLLFIVFATIAQDWRISIPIAIIGSAVPFIFIDSSLALVFAVGIFLSLLLSNLNLDVVLKSYLNFQPTSLLGPTIKHLSGLLILAACITFFLSTNKIIAQKGFQIPDSLIDTAMSIVPTVAPTEGNSPALPTIDPKQLELLKKNPELLKQSGLDPSILDNLSQSKTSQAPQNLATELIKQTVKDQVQNFIKPYLSFIPAILAVLLFFTLQFLVSVINLLISPLLWLIFYTLEKTGFVKFTTEQRTVKKLVV